MYIISLRNQTGEKESKVRKGVTDEVTLTSLIHNCLSCWTAHMKDDTDLDTIQLFTWFICGAKHVLAIK